MTGFSKIALFAGVSGVLLVGAAGVAGGGYYLYQTNPNVRASIDQQLQKFSPAKKAPEPVASTVPTPETKPLPSNNQTEPANKETPPTLPLPVPVVKNETVPPVETKISEPQRKVEIAQPAPAEEVPVTKPPVISAEAAKAEAARQAREIDGIAEEARADSRLINILKELEIKEFESISGGGGDSAEVRDAQLQIMEGEFKSWLAKNFKTDRFTLGMVDAFFNPEYLNTNNALIRQKVPQPGQRVDVAAIDARVSALIARLADEVEAANIRLVEAGRQPVAVLGNTETDARLAASKARALAAGATPVFREITLDDIRRTIGAKAVQSFQPVQPVQPVQPPISLPVETIRPPIVQPTQPAQPLQPIQPVQPVQPLPPARPQVDVSAADLTGTWERSDGKGSWVIDGRNTITARAGGKTTLFNYSYDDKTSTMSLGTRGVSSQYKAQRENNRLILQHLGSGVRFTKISQ